MEQDAAPDLSNFSTRRIPASRRQAAWDLALERACGPFQTDFGPAFDGRIDVRSVAGLAASRLIHNARAFRRGRRDVERGDPGCRHLVLQLSGRCQLSQAGREARLLPGEAAMIDSAKPSVMLFDAKTAQVWLHLPKPLLDGHAAGPARLATPSTGAAAALVGSMIRTAFGAASAWTPVQAQAIRESLIRLAAAIWQGADDRTPDRRRDETVPPIVYVIQNHIVTHLQSQSLTAEAIAEAHAISVRHLHRLFRLTGTTLGHWIRRSRLDRCATDMLDESLLGETITQIAYRWGFNDSAHFSRAFKAELGQSPRDYRMERRS